MAQIKFLPDDNFRKKKKGHRSIKFRKVRDYILITSIILNIILLINK